MAVAIDIFVQDDPVTFCDLTLTFLSMTFVLKQQPSFMHTNTLGEFELFIFHLTDPKAQNVETLHFDT